MAYTDYIRQTPEGYIRVVNSADYDSIVSYTPLPDITVFVDAVVNLPNTVQATFKSGKTETMIIKWERVNVDTSTAGTQKIYGDISNGAAAVLQNVIVNELSDLDILRHIRDANPTSQLPTLWLDSEDPYTQWEGVQFDNGKVVQLNMDSMGITNLPLVSKLSDIMNINANSNPIANIELVNCVNLQSFNCSSGRYMVAAKIENCYNLSSITLNRQKLTQFIFINNPKVVTLMLGINKLTSIPTLTSKGLIANYNFTENYFPTAELDRFRALGFTDESKLLPQNT